MNKLNGWFGYAKWADTFSFRQKILSKIPEIYNNTPSQ
jgi:hypothetical protein